MGVHESPSSKYPNQSDSDLKPIHQSTTTVRSANTVRSEYSVIRRTNYLETLIHLLKACICSGTFAMGDAMKNAGLVLGSIGIVVLGLICAYNNHMLVRSSIVIRKKLKLADEPNFPETVELCFQYGPVALRKWRNFMRHTVKGFIVSTQLGFCSVYFVFVASTIETILDGYGYRYDSRIYISMALLPILLSSLIRSLKLLTPLSLLSNILILSGICMAAYICCINLPSISERRLVSHYTNWPLFLGTTIYAFEGISIVIPLRNEMENPDQFTSTLGVLNVGLSIVVGVAVCMGFLSYLKYGDAVKGSFTLNFDQGIFTEVIMSIVALGILFTYPIQFHVAVDLIWWDLVAARGPFTHMIRCEILLRIVLVLFTYVMAVAVPQLNLFISLIGAMCSTTLALVLPALCDITLRSCPEENPVFSIGSPTTGISRRSLNSMLILRYTMDAISLILALVVFITGTFYSMKDIIEVFWLGEKLHQN